MAIIRKTINGKTQIQCQGKLEKAMKAWGEGGCKASERGPLDALYRECSQFDEDCPACVTGRAEFAKALDSFKAGDLDMGLALMKNSFVSVRYKWSKLKESFLGKG